MGATDETGETGRLFMLTGRGVTDGLRGRTASVLLRAAAPPPAPPHLGTFLSSSCRRHSLAGGTVRADDETGGGLAASHARREGTDEEGGNNGPWPPERWERSGRNALVREAQTPRLTRKPVCVCALDMRRRT
jgi:hypothetical protein